MKFWAKGCVSLELIDTDCHIALQKILNYFILPIVDCEYALATHPSSPPNTMLETSKLLKYLGIW